MVVGRYRLAKSLSANQCGEMKLSVETDMVAVNTHFKDLFNPTWCHDAGHAEGRQRSRSSVCEKSQFAKARIDIRRFSQFLSSQHVNPNRVICNIVDNRVVHFYLMHEDLTLQYFMPVVSK